MTEKQRTASEIRAYCEAATKPPWSVYDNTGFWHLRDSAGGFILVYSHMNALDQARANAQFSANARTDLPRVLEAAAALRTAFQAAWVLCTDKESALLAETAWLSPEAPVSPDGESGGESENDG